MPIALEIVVAFGIPIAWGVWELVSLRREQARDRLKEASAPGQIAEAAEAAAALDAASASAPGSAATPSGRG